MSDDGWTVVSAKKKTGKKKPSGPVSGNFQEAQNFPSFGGGHQDWKEITFVKRNKPSTDNYQKQEKKYVMSSEQRRMSRLDRADDVFKNKKVKPELSRKISEYRREFGLTQTQLAQKLNMKTEIVKSYELGTAIHNPAYTSKFYRLINAKRK